MIVSTNSYAAIKETTIRGRYVVNAQLMAFLDRDEVGIKTETVGYSVQNRPIQTVTLGIGTKKILMWSQMHGNESTTTKAVLDLINLLGRSTELSDHILKNCTIRIIPILNPDGAHAYARVNANQVDLNRDAQERSQPESKVLRAVYEDFQPDFCFNLHDQRTIYNVGTSPNPATISFLAPAHDVTRSISDSRATSMQLIVAMNEALQKIIPGQVGRYDDAFNANCVGDTFQLLRTPTVLFEAGHFPEDYQREKTREHIFHALITALDVIGAGTIEDSGRDAYFDIPENQKLFFDILIKNAPSDTVSETKDVGILFEEVLRDGKITFAPKIEKQGNLAAFFGHHTYNCLQPKDLESLKTTKFWQLLNR